MIMTCRESVAMGDLKDNTNLELPSKQVGFKMSFCGEITNVSCRDEFSDRGRLIK